MSTQQEKSSKQEIAEIWKLFRETDQQIKETSREVKSMSREIKRLEYLFTGHWGKLMESLVRRDLIRLLKERNIKVDYILHSEERQGTYKERQWEVDIIAVNGKEVVVVEVKTTLKVEHVSHFIKKLELFTKWRPRYKDSKIYGAVAYLKADQDSDIYSEKQGLFVIKAIGDSANIINESDFKPKVFS